MKRFLFSIIILLAGFSSVFAQNEISVDSLHTNIFPKGGTQEETVLPEVKNYDGFLLDMSLMKMTPPQLPKFTLEMMPVKIIVVFFG